MRNPFRRQQQLTAPELAVLRKFQHRRPGPDFSGVGTHGPSVPLARVPPVALKRTDRLAQWHALGEGAWDVLAKKRIKDIFPECDDGLEDSEFLRYWELICRSSLRFRREIFVGLQAAAGHPAPLFVPRSTFDSHGLIMGESNRGKSSQALTTLLLQLAWPESPGEKPPAILIIDLKPQGDRFLRAVAEIIAEKRGQTLRFFSNSSHFESLRFDPWSTLLLQEDLQARAEIMFKALSLIHAESQDAEFFMNEQSYTLEEALALPAGYKRPPLTSLRALIDRLERMTRDKGGNREARGIHGALSAFRRARNVIVEEPPGDRTNLIDFDALFEQGEVLYVHLESDDKHRLSQKIGKFVIACLLTVAKHRRNVQGKKNDKAFVAIDEFQRLAAHNIVSYLEASRGLGVSFLLSQQTPESLMSGNVDLFSLLFDTTSFQQYLTLTNDRVIERLKIVSGRISENLSSSSRGESHSTMRTSGFSHQGQSNTSGEYFFGSSAFADRWGESTTHGSSSSVSDGTSTQEGSGAHEVKIPGLTPEMDARVNDPAERLSLVYVRGKEASTLSPLQGLPTLIQRIFPFSARRAKQFEDRAWPQRIADACSRPAADEDSTASRVSRGKKKGGTKLPNFEGLYNNAGPIPAETKASGAGSRRRAKKTKGSGEPYV